MGILDPSPEDKNENKKPRYLQDMLAFIIMVVVGGIAILVMMLT